MADFLLFETDDYDRGHRWATRIADHAKRNHPGADVRVHLRGGSAEVAAMLGEEPGPFFRAYTDCREVAEWWSRQEP